MKFTSFDYMKTFIQPWPYYILKYEPDFGWLTRTGKIRKRMVESHLSQSIILGSLSKWYPNHGIIDIDDRSRKEVDRIRDKLGMGVHNSLLCSSQSPNSYHILFIPTCNYKPPTIDLLNNSFKSAAKDLRIEIYPQKEKCVRLPFGYNQRVIDYEVETWEEAYEYFLTLESYPLAEIPLELNENGNALPDFDGSSVYYEGKSLLETGLVEPSSRHDSQFAVLYYLWRSNIDYEAAIDNVFSWIMNKHNGYSRTINKHGIIKAEICRQAKQIWSYYSKIDYYPDSTNNAFYGYITKSDLLRIIKLSNGSIVRMRFLFNLVKYCNPRRLRSEGISVHSKILSTWSDPRVYSKRIEELENDGTIIRSNGYCVGRTAKKIILNWEYSNPEGQILINGRSPEIFEDAVSVCFKTPELRKILIASGMKSSNVSRFIYQVYQNVSTYN